MDDGSTLGSYATVESHEVLPQLPGYRTNAHKTGSKKQSLKYIEGQRYLLETGGPSAAKLSSSNSATSRQRVRASIQTTCDRRQSYVWSHPVSLCRAENC